MSKIQIEIEYIYKFIGFVSLFVGAVISFCGVLLNYIYTTFREQNNREHNDIKKTATEAKTEAEENSQDIEYIKGRLKL